MPVDTRSFFHHPDRAARGAAIEEAERSAALAAHLGAPGIRVFGDRVQPGADLASTRAWIVESLGALRDRLRGSGVEVWLETHGDFARAADACDGAEPDLRHNCYLSLGTAASGMTVQNTPKVIQLCTKGDPGYQPWCFVGAVKNYVDVTADPEDGLRFCEAVPAGNNKRQCYVAVGEQILILHISDPAARQRACGKARPEGKAECLYGAGLLTQPPAGLPLIQPGLLRN